MLRACALLLAIISLVLTYRIALQIFNIDAFRRGSRQGLVWFSLLTGVGIAFGVYGLDSTWPNDLSAATYPLVGGAIIAVVVYLSTRWQMWFYRHLVERIDRAAERKRKVD
jgi:hypothetical protein